MFPVITQPMAAYFTTKSTKDAQRGE